MWRKKYRNSVLLWFQTKPFLVQFSLLSSIILWLQFLCRYIFPYCSVAFWSTFVWGFFWRVFIGFFFVFCYFLMFLKISNFELVVKSSLWPLLLTEVPLPPGVFGGGAFRYWSGHAGYLSCLHLALLAELHLLYLLCPIFPVWTWPFWQGSVSLICSGCSAGWWWSVEYPLYNGVIVATVVLGSGFRVDCSRQIVQDDFR